MCICVPDVLDVGCVGGRGLEGSIGIRMAGILLLEEIRKRGEIGLVFF